MDNKFLDQDRQIPIDPNVDISAIITREDALEQTISILSVDNMYLSEEDLDLLKAVSEGNIPHSDVVREIITRETQKVGRTF